MKVVCNGKFLHWRVVKYSSQHILIRKANVLIKCRGRQVQPVVCGEVKSFLSFSPYYNGASTETILPSFFKLWPQPCNCSAFKAIWPVATETCCALQKLMTLKGNTRLWAHGSLCLNVQFASFNPRGFFSLFTELMFQRSGVVMEELWLRVLFSLKAAGLHLLCGFHTE